MYATLRSYIRDPPAMEYQRLKTLQLLEAIAEDKPTSQRELSVSLQISLGLVNSFIKRLVKKGYCKVTTIPKNRVRYILTPSGALEKTRLTYKYIATSYNYFKTATERLRHLYAELKKENATRVVFYGTGELADIAWFSMTGFDVRLIDVVDPQKTGTPFAHTIVKDASRLKKTDFDVVIVTAIQNHELVVHAIEKAGISSDKIRFFK
jgi:DNA-binding MarR family transcriptional regulator